MERRLLLPKRKRQPPFHFREEIPQPPVPLSWLSSGPSTEAPATGCLTGSSVPHSIVDYPTADHGILSTFHNVFGLFQHYTVTVMDAYDPDERLLLSDMSNIPELQPVNPTESNYYLFPNRSSFHLADWHWNGGVQKLLGSICNLVSLITDPEFRAEDIKNTRWNLTYRELGTDDKQEDWLDTYPHHHICSLSISLRCSIRC